MKKSIYCCLYSGPCLSDQPHHKLNGKMSANRHWADCKHVMSVCQTGYNSFCCHFIHLLDFARCCCSVANTETRTVWHFWWPGISTWLAKADVLTFVSLVHFSLSSFPPLFYFASAITFEKAAKSQRQIMRKNKVSRCTFKLFVKILCSVKLICVCL